MKIIKFRLKYFSSFKLFITLRFHNSKYWQKWDDILQMKKQNIFCLSQYCAEKIIHDVCDSLVHCSGLRWTKNAVKCLFNLQIFWLLKWYLIRSSNQTNCQKRWLLLVIWPEHPQPSTPPQWNLSVKIFCHNYDKNLTFYVMLHDRLRTSKINEMMWHRIANISIFGTLWQKCKVTSFRHRDVNVIKSIIMDIITM